jgi:hypothetical protein
MNIDEANRFALAWHIWEQGRSDGIAQAIEMAEKLLGRDKITAQQQEVLHGMYNWFLRLLC